MAELSFCHFFFFHIIIFMSVFKNKFANANYLDLVPSKEYGHVIEENGLVSVLIPRFTNPFLVATVGRLLKSPNVKVKFDTFGTELWLEIDNKKSVGKIIENLKSKFGEDIEPAYERVTSFLTKIYKYKFITFNEINS